MNNPSGKILLELLLSPDTPSELFWKYKEQLLLYLAAGEEAVNELNHIDHILSDRPVLDKFNSRVEKIEHCIISSKNGDESAKLLKFETARLNAADNRIAELEKEVERIRDAMERLKHYNHKLLDDGIIMDNEIIALKAGKREPVEALTNNDED